MNQSINHLINALYCLQLAQVDFFCEWVTTKPMPMFFSITKISSEVDVKCNYRVSSPPRLMFSAVPWQSGVWFHYIYMVCMEKKKWQRASKLKRTYAYFINHLIIFPRCLATTFFTCHFSSFLLIYFAVSLFFALFFVFGSFKPFLKYFFLFNWDLSFIPFLITFSSLQAPYFL